MRLDGVLTQAASGLESVTRRLGTVSQNVANANTPDYVRETLPVDSLVAGGIGMGVRSGVATRSVDAALQADLFAAGGHVADGQVRQAALAAIDEASGAPGSGQDLPGLVGALRDAFSTLASDPSNQTQQRTVINRAGDLARGINGLGNAIGAARQLAQDNLVNDVQAANVALRSVGQLSDQVIAARSRGESTAALEDSRDVAMRAATALTGAQFLPQTNGGLLAFSGGTSLPLGASSGPLALGNATLGPGTTAPAVTVVGALAPLGGGRIGAELDLRDVVLPGLQTGVDGFAHALTSGFVAQGLALFTDASGTVPTTAGYAQTIQVNPAVKTSPRMVRDGSAAAGAAGDTTLIDAVLSSVLNGGSGTISGQASDLVAGHAQLAATAASRLSSDQGVQSSLQAKLNAQTGVSVDTEMTDMVRLQNSYGANARVISAVQAMWDQLLSAVR